MGAIVDSDHLHQAGCSAPNKDWPSASHAIFLGWPRGPLGLQPVNGTAALPFLERITG